MANQAAFTQISAVQWTSLSATFQDKSKVFNSEMARRIDFALAQAMDASSAFKSYLSALLQLNTGSGPNENLNP
jgi:hypothetical protein